MNAEICTDYFSFVLLVLKYVEQLVPQVTFSWFFFFNFQEKQKSKPQTESVILAWICFFQNCKNTEHLIIDRVSNRKENLSKDSHILFPCNSLRRKNCCFMFIFFFPSSELKLNSSLIWFLSYFIYHILVEKAARTLMFYISWCVCKIKGSKHTDDCQFTLSVEDY